MDKKGLNMNISDSEIPIFFTGDQVLGQLLTRGCHNRAMTNTTAATGDPATPDQADFQKPTLASFYSSLLISNNLQFGYTSIVE